MNTKILLAIAGAVALSACSKNKKTEPVGWEFPLVEPEKPTPVRAPAVAGRSRPRPPKPKPKPAADEFRQPDPTTKLYDPRKGAAPDPAPVPAPAPVPGDPLSIIPPATPPVATPPPDIIPVEAPSE